MFNLSSGKTGIFIGELSHHLPADALVIGSEPVLHKLVFD